MDNWGLGLSVVHFSLLGRWRIGGLGFQLSIFLCWGDGQLGAWAFSCPFFFVGAMENWGLGLSVVHFSLLGLGFDFHCQMRTVDYLW
jgi:hypothetical protein